MTSAPENVVWHPGRVSARERELIAGQRGCVVWFTGLSGSGKSTVARSLERRLVDAGRLAYVLDGDNLRHGLNSDLGFSPEHRVENIRRVAEVAALFADAALVTLVAFISPYRRGRALARRRIGRGRFIEVFVKAPLSLCEERDPKGLYRRARAGEIPDFTGIDAPYEEPEGADVVLDTAVVGVEAAVDALMTRLEHGGFLEPPADDEGR